MDFRQILPSSGSSETNEAYLRYLKNAAIRMRRGPYGLHRIFLPRKGYKAPSGLFQLADEDADNQNELLGLLVVAGTLKGKKWGGPIFLYEGQTASLYWNSDWLGQVLALEATVVGDLTDAYSLVLTLEKAAQEWVLKSRNRPELINALWENILPRLIKGFVVLRGVELSPKPFLYLYELARYHKNLSKLTDGILSDSVFEGPVCFRKGQMVLPPEPTLDIIANTPSKTNEEKAGIYLRLLASGGGLDIYQKTAAIGSLENNLTYIQGPPGNGKTHIAATIALAGLLGKKSVGFASFKKSASEAFVDRLSKILGVEVSHRYPALLGLQIKGMNIIDTGNPSIPLDWKITLIKVKQAHSLFKTLCKWQRQKADYQKLLAYAKSLLPNAIIPKNTYYVKTIYERFSNPVLTKGQLLQLRSICRTLGIKGYSNQNSIELLKAFCLQVLLPEKISDLDKKASIFPSLHTAQESYEQAKQEWLLVKREWLLKTLDAREEEVRMSLLQGLKPHYGCEIFNPSQKKSLACDILLVDEATELDLYNGLRLSGQCQKLILLGDHKQLGIEGLGLHSGLGKELDHLLWQRELGSNPLPLPKISQTSFVDMVRKKKETTHFFLKNHYRCRLELAETVSQMFYEGLLIPKNQTAENKPPILFIEYEGSRNPKTAIVPEETTAILNYWERLTQEEELKTSVYGILTYSAAQKKLLISRAKKRGISLPFLGTVEEWRGKETEILLVSPAIGELPATAYWNSSKRMAVTLSRASKQIIWFHNKDSNTWELAQTWMHLVKKVELGAI